MKKGHVVYASVLAAALFTTMPGFGNQPIVHAEGKERSLSQKDVKKWTKDALEKMYLLMPELKEFSLSSGETDENDDEESEIKLHLIKTKKEKYPYAIITLDPNKREIISFFYNEGQKDSGATPTIAKEKSNEFLKQMLGSKQNQYQIDEEGSNSSGRVMYNRMINGIPFRGSGITIMVNESGKVISFSQNVYGHPFDDLGLFPTTDQAMSPEEAVATMAKSLRLVYASKGNRDGSGPILKYVPEMVDVMNAQTGAIEHSFSANSNKYTNAKKVISQGKALLARNKDEAAAIVTNELDMDMEGMEYREDIIAGDNKRFEWRGSNGQMIFVHSNPNTGEVNNFGTRGFDGKGDIGITREEAELKALQTLQKYLDKKITALHIRDEYTNDKLDAYNFYFHNSYQNIPIEDDEYEVKVSRSTGKIVEVRGPFKREQVAMPDSSTAVSLEVAMQAYMQNHRANLIYDALGKSGRADRPELVYSIVPNQPGLSHIDAFTGKPVSYPLKK